MAGKFTAICFHEFAPGNEYRAFGASDEAEPLKKVKVIADYLYTKNVKFCINVVTKYVNSGHPEQNITIWDTSSLYIQEFINTLNYLKSKGGVIQVEDTMDLTASIINMTEFEMNYWLEPYIAAFNYHFYLEFSYMILDGSGNWIYDPVRISPLQQVIQDGITDTTGNLYSGLPTQGYKFKKIKELVPFIPMQPLETRLTSIQRVFRGDFNGDGKDDLVVWNMVDGSWTVYLSNIVYPAPEGSNSKGFVLSGIWLANWGAGAAKIPLIADVNGDGKDDLIIYCPDTGNWRVALSNGSEFVSQGIWLSNWAKKTAQSSWRVMAGDFNGDGKTDILATDAISVQVALSTGASFATQSPWLSYQKSGTVFAGDFNGDGKDDIVIWDSIMGNWYVALSTGDNFIQQSEPWLSNWALSSNIWQPLIGDVDGDGKDDLIVYAPSIGNWQFGLSSGTLFVASNMIFGPWGITTSGSAVTGDFNGDGKTDIGLQDMTKGTFDISISPLQD